MISSAPSNPHQKKKLKNINFSYKHDQFRTGFISTQSLISNTNVRNTEVFPILWPCQAGISRSLETAGLRGQIIKRAVLWNIGTGQWRFFLHISIFLIEWHTQKSYSLVGDIFIILWHPLAKRFLPGIRNTIYWIKKKILMGSNKYFEF